MANVIVYAPTGVEVEVIAGDPPVDQSEEVATLQAAAAVLRDERDAAVQAVATLQAKIDAAVAALTG